MWFCPGVCSVSPGKLGTQNLSVRIWGLNAVCHFRSGFSWVAICLQIDLAEPPVADGWPNTPQKVMLFPQPIPVLRATWEPLSTKNRFYSPRNKTLRRSSQAGGIHLTILLGSAWFYQFHFTLPMKSILYPSILISVSIISTTPSAVRFPGELEDARRSRLFPGSKYSGNILSAWET